MAVEEPEDFSNLSPEELVVHKSWKARLKGYEDALKIFAKATSEKDPVFNKYLGLVKDFVSDSNQVALEKGLDAAYSFVENASVSPKTAGEVCPLIVQKCLGLPKQKLREKAQDILLMYIEVGEGYSVVEALLQGLRKKNPKLVSAVLVTFTTAINQFGPKAISIKQLIKHIGPMMEHRDGDVRAKTKALAVEFYRWIGNALKPQLQTLTPLQHNELEAEFANVGTEKPSPARYLRSQKPRGRQATQRRMTFRNRKKQQPVDIREDKDISSLASFGRTPAQYKIEQWKANNNVLDDRDDKADAHSQLFLKPDAVIPTSNNSPYENGESTNQWEDYGDIFDQLPPAAPVHSPPATRKRSPSREPETPAKRNRVESSSSDPESEILADVSNEQLESDIVINISNDREKSPAVEEPPKDTEKEKIAALENFRKTMRCHTATMKKALARPCCDASAKLREAFEKSQKWKDKTVELFNEMQTMKKTNGISGTESGTSGSYEGSPPLGTWSSATSGAASSSSAWMSNANANAVAYSSKGRTN